MTHIERPDGEDVAQPVPYEATCDRCAEGPKKCLITEDGCYLCLDCIAFHERAIDAAVAALHDAARNGGTTLREVVAISVKTYCEFTDEGVTTGGQS